MELIQFDSIYSALQEAQTIEEVKDGYNKLEALQYYAKQQHMGYEIEFKIAIARIDFACKGGEILEEIVRPGNPSKMYHNGTIKLSDIDLSRNQSSRWQKLKTFCQIAPQTRQAYQDEMYGKREVPSINGLLKLDKELKHSEAIEEQRQQIEENGPQPPSGLFDTIAIDPPWPYGTKYSATGRRSANPYPEMSLEQIKAIQLPAADDCILWLWTTHKFMRYSFDILDTWQFRDVSIVTWVKDRMATGSWLRSQTEFCIMAVKGTPLIDLTNQVTILYGELREHSRKPDSFYEMVDSLCVGYKLDYFSREQRDGWITYGNDTEKFS